jgi:hypothetical protein
MLGTLHSMHHGRKIDQECIPNGFDDVAVMRAHGLLNNLVENFQQAQHPCFVAAHLPTKADDVREHDRG